MEKDPKEPTNVKLLENFNLIKLHCIGCGSDELEKEIPRVRNTTFEEKIADGVIVCEQFITINNQAELEKNRRFLITCISCKKCGRRFSLTAVDHGKSEIIGS